MKLLHSWEILLNEILLKLRKTIVTIENMTTDSDLAQYIEQIFMRGVPSFVNFNQCKFNDSEEISNYAILADVGFSMTAFILYHLFHQIIIWKLIFLITNWVEKTKNSF